MQLCSKASASASPFFALELLLEEAFPVQLPPQLFRICFTAVLMLCSSSYLFGPDCDPRLWASAHSHSPACPFWDCVWPWSSSDPILTPGCGPTVQLCLCLFLSPGWCLMLRARAAPDAPWLSCLGWRDRCWLSVTALMDPRKPWCPGYGEFLALEAP